MKEIEEIDSGTVVIQNCPGVTWEVRTMDGKPERNGPYMWTVTSTLPQCYGWLLDSGTAEDWPEAEEDAKHRARAASRDAVEKGLVEA